MNFWQRFVFQVIERLHKKNWKKKLTHGNKFNNVIWNGVYRLKFRTNRSRTNLEPSKSCSQGITFNCQDLQHFKSVPLTPGRETGVQTCDPVWGISHLHRKNMGKMAQVCHRNNEDLGSALLVLTAHILCYCQKCIVLFFSFPLYSLKMRKQNIWDSNII